MDDKVREALDYLAGFHHLIEVTATIRAHIEGLEARAEALASEKSAMFIRAREWAERGGEHEARAESAEARVRELEGLLRVPKEPTEAMIAAYTALDYTDLIEFNYYGGMTGWDLTVTPEGARNAWAAMFDAAMRGEAGNG